MRGKGQLLLSTLLLLCLNVVAQNEGAHAKVDSDSDEGKVRVTSSLLTSPGVGISSSSSSSSSSGGGAAAFTGQAAALHEGLDAVQTKLSPSFAPGSAESSLFFMNHAHKLPFQAASTSSGGRAQNASSSVRQQESVKREENSHLLYPRYFPRTRRGGYTAPYFVGKRRLQEKADQEQEFEKRYILSGIRMDGLQNPQESLNREAAIFTDKRRSPLFVGKRSSIDHSEDNERRVKRQAYNAPYFVGKRALEESEDLEQEELQKREVPDDDPADDLPILPLEAKVRDFDPNDATLFPDKRRAPLFIGKRRAPFFVGKRWAPYFVGKRQAAPYFVGKRTYPTISSRAAPLFVGRRRYAPLFVGKRHAPMFVGKRRAPMFVGKRPSKDLNELLSALHTLQAARHYRRMIQADKRHNAPFFIGRRSAPQLPTDITDDTPEDNGNNFR